MNKAQKARIDRRNARPYTITYPATDNLPVQVVLHIPATAKRKQIVQALRDLNIPGLLVCDGTGSCA